MAASAPTALQEDLDEDEDDDDLDEDAPATETPAAETPGTDQDSPGTESPEEETEEPETGEDDDGLPQEEFHVTCSGAILNAGETHTVQCNTSPGASLSLGSTASQVGGTVSLSGSDITYTAPAAYRGTGQDLFTVIAAGPDGQEARTQVIFTVHGNATDPGTPATTPPPTEAAPPAAPDSPTSGTQNPDNGTGPTSPGMPTQQSPTSGTTSPGAPTSPSPTATSSAPSWSESPLTFFPLPGFPQLDQDIPEGPQATASASPEGPEETSEEDDEAAESDADREDEDENYGDLAETGMGTAGWAALTAAVALLLGGIALLLSRRTA
ncbi:hypothetical protein GCM10009771_07200 [Nesterenkonia flava]